jgi:hypothetical protein
MSEINFDDLWASVKKETPQPMMKKDFPMIEDGKYNVSVKFAQVDLTSDRKQVSFQYQIVGHPKHENRIFFINFGMDEKGLPILKRELQKMDIDVDKIKKVSELSDAVGTLIGKRLNVYAKRRTYMKKDGTQGTAYNCYVQGALVTDLKDTGNEPPAMTDSDEISF